MIQVRGYWKKVKKADIVFLLLKRFYVLAGYNNFNKITAVF